MESNIYKSFSEVIDIIEHSEIEIQQKIPDKLKQLLKENRDTNYILDIDYSKDINEQELLQETREILAMIYRDYLCSDEEKNEIIVKNKKAINELQEQYDISKIFEQRKQKDNMQEEKNALIATEKISWYKKIIRILVGFFQK